MFSFQSVFALLKQPLAIFITCSIVALILVNQYGPDPGLTYDSYDYIQSSESTSTYFTGQNHDHHSYLYHPPALPFFLHFFSNKILAAKWLNACCYILSLWLCYLIGKQFTLKNTFLFSFVAIVAISFPWVQNHFFIWTEPLFGTCLLFLSWMILTQKKWYWIILICALLFFIRKTGLFLAAGMILIYFLDREYKVALKSTLLMSLLFGSWELVTFYFSKGSLSMNIFSDLVNQSRWIYADAFSAWFLPRNINLIVRLFLLISIPFGFLFYFRKKLKAFLSHKDIQHVLVLVITYFLFFVLFLGASEFSEADRYLSVMLPLIMLLMITIIQFIGDQIGKNGKYAIIPLILWMAYPISRTFYHLFQ